MNNVTALHRDAMVMYDLALEARSQKDYEGASNSLRAALNLEREAAFAVPNNPASEPSRSILYRSAASLALQCEELREAERLIAIGLSGEPPEEIANELRDLLEEVYFNRHLEQRGIVLDRSELQFSISGQAVGHGIALSSDFVNRVQYAERLFLRTAERKRDQPFREKGSARRTIREEYELFVSVPRAASFAITLKLGHTRPQMTLDGMDDLSDVVQEVMGCLDLFSNDDEQALHLRIPDAAYYDNFVSLARQLAPDGRNVSQVGFTAIQGGREIRVAMRERPSHIGLTRSPRVRQRNTLSISGVLQYADALSRRARHETGKIKVVDEQGIEYSVIVPKGLMNDIIKPLWGETVRVEGTQTSFGILLDDIHRIEETS